MNAETITLAKAQARLCSTFGNHRRVLILWCISAQEKSVSTIAEEINATMQNTSHHLRIMKERGVLVSRRDGQTVFYRVADNDLMRNCRLLHSAEQYLDNDTLSISPDSII